MNNMKQDNLGLSLPGVNNDQGQQFQVCKKPIMLFSCNFCCLMKLDDNLSKK